MWDRPNPAGTRRWILFGFALLFGLSTAVVLVLSVSSLRDRIGFERAFDRIERLIRTEGNDEEYRRAIEDAAEYARTRGQFFRLLELAWSVDDESRWSLIVSVTSRARDRNVEDTLFRQVESYARSRTGDRMTAKELVSGQGDSLSQRLRIFAEIDLGEPAASRARLTALGMDDDAPELYRIVARAFGDPRAPDLVAAWETFGARAFAVNGALAAATAGDRSTARRASDPLRTRFDQDNPRPTLYLAAWLDDDEWLFSQLRSLEGRRVVEPEIFLLQADGHLRQGQFSEARAIYREIIATRPEVSAVPFLNLAVINERLAEGPVDELYRTGLSHHMTSRDLRIAWGTRLIRRGRRLEAAQVVAPVALREGDHETWLLARAVLGTRRPVARLESDLWGYINRYPDALEVAAFLARFLTVRNDRQGLDVLRSRYDADTAAWARVLHAEAALADNDWNRAETILAEGESLELAYNRAVFALFHRDRNEIERTIAVYREEFERDVRITTQRRTQAEIRSLLLMAESARLRNEEDQAVALLERAELIGYPSTRVARYRALLAGAR